MAGLLRRDRALIFVVLLAVAVLVGMAVRPGAGGAGSDIAQEPIMIASQTVVWLILAADVLVTLAIIDAVWSRRAMQIPVKPRRWTETLATYLAALVPSLLAALLIVYVRRRSGGGALMSIPGMFLNGPLPASRGSRLAAAAGANEATWLGLVFAVLIVILFLGWLLWPAPQRKKVAVRAAPPPANPVVAAVEESLDALRAIPDPRKAIIAAYASMEGSMFRAGLPRRLSEAPIEYVTRILAGLVGLSADLTRLTQLFEVAKFSDHTIDEPMRSEAIGALSNIREQLRAESPT